MIKTFNAEDAKNASNDRLIAAFEDERIAEFCKPGIVREMRRRAENDRRGVIGYAGCAERFAEYLD